MHNQLAVTSIAKMTSREIAELTGKQHKHVLRDIDEMIAALKHGPNLGNQVISTTYVDGSNIERRQYELNKEMTMTLVTGYNVNLRNAVIKRWMELEAGQQVIPQDYASALRLAADTHEQLLLAQQREAEKQALIEAQRPDIEFVQQITHDPSSMSVAQAAKSIGTGEKRLYEFMRQNGWVDRKNVPYQSRVSAGMMDFSRSRYDSGNGEMKDKYTARITEKGKRLLLKNIKEKAPEILNSHKKKARAYREATGK